MTPDFLPSCHELCAPSVSGLGDERRRFGAQDLLLLEAEVLAARTEGAGRLMLEDDRGQREVAGVGGGGGIGASKSGAGQSLFRDLLRRAVADVGLIDLLGLKGHDGSNGADGADGRDGGDGGGGNDRGVDGDGGNREELFLDFFVGRFTNTHAGEPANEGLDLPLLLLCLLKAAEDLQQAPGVESDSSRKRGCLRGTANGRRWLHLSLRDAQRRGDGVANEGRGAKAQRSRDEVGSRGSAGDAEGRGKGACGGRLKRVARRNRSSVGNVCPEGAVLGGKVLASVAGEAPRVSLCVDDVLLRSVWLDSNSVV